MSVHHLSAMIKSLLNVVVQVGGRLERWTADDLRNSSRQDAPFDVKVVRGASMLLSFAASRARTLPHILKKCSRQHRQAKLDVKDDQPHADETPPDAHFDELSGVGHNGCLDYGHCVQRPIKRHNSRTRYKLHTW